MKKLTTNRAVLAGSLAAILFAVFALTTAFSAPVVVIPGEGAGYIYYSASSGGAAPAPAETGLGNVGMIAAFWKYPLPENWVECNGSPVPGEYTELIEYLGGVGAMVANTPDLRGYFLRAVNTDATGLDPGRVPGSTQIHQSNNLYQVNAADYNVGGTTTVPETGGWSGWVDSGDGGGGASLRFRLWGRETRPHNIAVIYAIKAK